jgi:hypothetical protein
MVLRVLVLAAALSVLHGRAAAQCRVSGPARFPHALVRGEIDLSRREIPRIEVPFPSPTEGPVEARLLVPIEGPVEISGVAFHLADDSRVAPQFFPEGTAGIEVVGAGVADLGGLRVHGLEVPCEALALGPGEFFRRRPDSGSTDAFVVEDSLVLYAEPDRASASIRLRVTNPEGPVGFDIVGRRGTWAQLRMTFDQGLVLTGWARWDAERIGLPTSGAGGFRGRMARAPSRIPRIAGCYEGPALFRTPAPLFTSEDGADVWAHVTADETLLVRDCGGARVELVSVLGVGGAWGWVDGSNIARIGAIHCGVDGVLLVQDPSSLRIRVGASATTLLEPGDEVVRWGDAAIVGPPFDTVTPVWPGDVCDAWLVGTRWVVVREGRRVEVRRGGP